MTLRERQWLFMQNVAKLIQKINELGYTASFGEVYRTPEQSEINAKKGIGIRNSLHSQKLAVDINLFKDGTYITDGTGHRELGIYWKSLHSDNHWGGDWKKMDFNHFEMSYK